LAEEFAYSDFDWIELILVDKWKDDNGKERFAFADGKGIELTISKNRFEKLKKLEIGQVINFKIHKQEITKEVEGKFAWEKKKTVKDYKFIPLLAGFSDKGKWSTLEVEYGYIEYINKEKKALHIISYKELEVFHKYESDSFKVGDYVSFRAYTKTIKGEKRTILVDVRAIDKIQALQNFKNRIVVIDDVNYNKNVFHFVLGKGLITGIASLNMTNPHPKVGDFLKVYYAAKKDKKGEKKIVPMLFENTDLVDSELQKSILGELEIKEGGFAFVENCYVSEKTLNEYNIIHDCIVSAKAVYTGKADKWKVYEILKL
jgi:hypothetical protein